MTERSEGIGRRVPVVTPSDVGGLMTERSEETAFALAAMAREGA
ncbi:hypothetical protein [Actinoallomurus iriomotensis]|uniref:Uncharacterized protein n=1 Tax=Actinoallomurus iriomotensis TaxID=478107 RepID=A0A9W6VQ30_9ACTN|nr:hypothetical protein [Actinoallomurus iriomotensis]GLY75459.1 hypothetical protein Airi01_037260 [Actinoallomurus iriomotensis]